MRTALCLVALLLVPVGCGAAGDQSGASPSTSTATETASHPTETVSLPLDEAEMTRPPPILLESAAGRQVAVLGSYCVTYTDEASGQGAGICTDSERPSPEQLSTARPGEEIRILLEDAEVTRPASVTVHPLGCERKTVAEIRLALGPATTWRVDLEPGVYELSVFTNFEAADGRTGDVFGALGLLVDETAPLEVVPVPADGSGCNRSQSPR